MTGKSANLWRYLGGFLIIGSITLLVYRGILFPANLSSLYPWASDTLGHVFKAEYLAQELRAGTLYPDLLPHWYMGMQMMRYHPPLPYYLLVSLDAILQDSISAASWFIALCACAGGLFWLLYQRWVGWMPALIGGVIFTFLPDNLRVALAEGNLPRTLATAILPLAFYFFLRVLEKGSTTWHRLWLAVCFSAIVLAHAMMAAIFAVCTGLVGFLFWMARLTGWRNLGTAILSISIGMLLSGWWLLPSLTGGITELDSSAMTEALAVFPIADYLNPWLRVGNPEAVYVGVVLIVLALAILVFRKRVSSQPVAFVLAGMFGLMITTPGFNQLFNALPLHNLLWPLRFLGVTSFLFLLAVAWALHSWGRYPNYLAILVVALLSLDAGGSLFLIHMRPQPPDVAAISQELARTSGWRVATLDQSRLGSSPSYFFSTDGKRDQIFGWAYQGAPTARTVAALNESLEMGHTAYLLNRLDLFGVDDVVLLNEQPGALTLQYALKRLGYQDIYRGESASLFHRDGSPRACLVERTALGIGRGAQNLAYIFPQILLGASNRVDDYTLEELAKYPIIVLSGFSWRDRQSSESLIREAAARGTRVLVDLTNAPVDPLARIPRFLGVWGEQVILSHEPLPIRAGARSDLLQPLGDPGALWVSHMLQGLQTEVWTFDYLGENAVLAGFNSYGQDAVWFVGLNIPYHTALTRDPAAISLLSNLLNLPPGGTANCEPVPLADFHARQDGYRFSYHLVDPGRLFVPIAYLEGMKAYVDGAQVDIGSLERLVVFEAPAGDHTVNFIPGRTPIYLLGQIATGTAIAGLALQLAANNLLPLLSRDRTTRDAASLPKGVIGASGSNRVSRR